MAMELPPALGRGPACPAPSSATTNTLPPDRQPGLDLLQDFSGAAAAPMTSKTTSAPLSPDEQRHRLWPTVVAAGACTRPAAGVRGLTSVITSGSWPAVNGHARKGCFCPRDVEQHAISGMSGRRRTHGAVGLDPLCIPYCASRVEMINGELVTERNIEN